MSDLNRDRTAQFILPSQCAGRIHKIVILDADSSAPRVDVTCAPAESGLEEMTPGDEEQ